MQQLYLPLKFGRLLITRVAQPAVATNFTYSAANAFVEQLVSVRFQLAADANGANRASFLDVTDATGVILSMSNDLAQSANSTFIQMFSQQPGNYSALFGTPDFAYTMIPPDTIIPRGGAVVSRIENIQAGDQISAIVVVTYVWARP